MLWLSIMEILQKSLNEVCKAENVDYKGLSEDSELKAYISDFAEVDLKNCLN